jgi:aconitate hydratase
MLLGVRAVFAESYERIHRSNLIGMGILPLQFKEGESAASLGLDGSETYAIEPIDFSAGLPNPAVVKTTATKATGECVPFEAVVRIDTPTEGAYYRHGGILQYVLRNLATE